MKKWIVMALCLLPISVWAAGSHSDDVWTLDQNRSTLNFVSIKKGHVGEVHHFDRITGEITGTTAQLHIDLSSVNTGIAIRNKRMQEHLFNTGAFATATASLTLTPALLAIKKGEIERMTQVLQLDLHGVKKDIKASLLVVGMGDALLVTTTQPILIHAADFSLDTGIEQLRKLAKLPSIATSVPVTLQLYFTRQTTP